MLAYPASLEVWPTDALTPEDFVSKVFREGRAHNRSLPWRYLDDPYQVLVSEIMLQQTQVKRVLRYWERFISMFPSIDALAASDSAQVLEEWQGLGYNRRALALHRAARQCASEQGGVLPATVEGLCELPGIGSATAAGVMAFAHNKPCVYLETNVRSVFLHELFPDEDAVPDKKLIPLIRAVCPDKPREWYYALLDYGAHLKAQGVNPSRRSAHYARQSAFEGSRRQKRAELLRIVLDEPGLDREEILRRLTEAEVTAGRQEPGSDLLASIIVDLEKEGFFSCRDGLYYA